MEVSNGAKIVKAIKDKLYEVILVELSNGKYKVLSLRMTDEDVTVSETIDDFLHASYVFDTRLKELEGN